MENSEILELASGIQLLAMDVDGVLTDGSLYFSDQGEELKAFNILDGQGIKMLHQAGIETAIITGRSSPLTERRARNLGIRWLYQGREDKAQALTELARSCSIPISAMAYVGDDLPDLAAIEQAALGISVPNAYHAVRDAADWCTSQPGGQGAVREIADLLLSARGVLEQALEAYRRPS